ncbi:Rid family hydrolase, partial [Bacillus sp. MUM 116]
MEKYPKAIGPYSVYRKTGNLIYTSGQLPIDPERNEFP